jgi:hypothetical protein
MFDPGSKDALIVGSDEDMCIMDLEMGEDKEYSEFHCGELSPADIFGKSASCSPVF